MFLTVVKQPSCRKRLFRDLATLGEVIVTPNVTNVFGPIPVGVPPTTFAFPVPLHKSPYPGIVRTGQYKSWAELASSTQSLHTAPFI